jgi:hypothetical protein
MKRRGFRAAVARSVTSIPFLRNFYLRRTLKFIEKSKAKGRRLPPELAAIEAQLSRIPERGRKAALEAALKAGQDGPGSRAVRRSADRQSRQSSRGRAKQPAGASRPARPPAAPAARGRKAAPIASPAKKAAKSVKAAKPSKARQPRPRP